jgi:hypothetical protein
MRISADPRDPGYVNYRQFHRARVFLDGAEQFGVLIADEEEGVIVRYKRNAAGQFVLDKSGLRVARERCRGTVRVEARA